MEMDLRPGPSGRHTVTVGRLLAPPCPASIWLLGQAAQCVEPEGHDRQGPNGEPGTMHEVRLRWTTS